MNITELTDMDKDKMASRILRIMDEVSGLSEDALRTREQHRKQIDDMKIEMAAMATVITTWRARCLDAEKSLSAYQELSRVESTKR